MKKIFKLLLFFLLLLVVGYIIIWYITLHKLTYKLNTKFSNKDLVIYSNPNHDQEKLFFRFTRAKKFGFPFSLGVKLLNPKYVTPEFIIECQNPIKIKYDLRHQFLSNGYYGKCIHSSLPLQQELRNQINLDVTFKNDIPLSKKLLKVLKSKNSFELINVIKDYNLILNNFELYDLTNNYLKAKLGPSYIKFNFNNHPYYFNLAQFYKDIPKNYFFDIKITNAHSNTNIQSSFIAKGSLETQYKYAEIINILKNCKINLEQLIYDTNSITADHKLTYEAYTIPNNESLKYNYRAEFDIKDQLETARFLLWYMKAASLGIENTKLTDLDFKNMLNILFTFDQKSFEELENSAKKLSIPQKITFNSIGEFKTQNKNFNHKIDKFMLFFDNIGLDFQYFSEKQNNNIELHQGNIALFNYKSIVKYLINLNTILYNEEELISNLNNQVWSNFLLAISNHPESISDNIIIEYNIDFKKRNNINDIIKISNRLSLTDLKNIYRNILYQEVYKMAEKFTMPGLLVQKLLPYLQNRQDIIEKLNNCPEQISNELWKEIFDSIII